MIDVPWVDRRRALLALAAAPFLALGLEAVGSSQEQFLETIRVGTARYAPSSRSWEFVSTEHFLDLANGRSIDISLWRPM